MPPLHDRGHHVWADLPFLKKHFEDLVLENLLHGLCVKARRNPEHSLPAKKPSEQGMCEWGLKPKKSPRL